MLDVMINTYQLHCEEEEEEEELFLVEELVEDDLECEWCGEAGEEDPLLE